MQHIITKCLGELYKYDTDIKAFCTNIDANDEELFRFHKEWIENDPATSNVFNYLRDSAQIPKQKSMGLTYEQLSDIRFEGGFKESYINGVEQIVSHTADISNWVELKEKIFKDLLRRILKPQSKQKVLSEIKWLFSELEARVLRKLLTVV